MIKYSFLAFALVSSLAGGTAAADVKCSPDIKVDYVTGSGTSIKVTKIQYRLDGTSTWHDEGVTNKVIDKGKSHTFKSQRLGSVAKGQKLDLRVVFKPDTGNDYGAEQTSDIRNSGKACENNVTYLLKVD
jgi:hypothetical protein